MYAKQDPKEFQLHFCVRLRLIAVFSGNLQPDVTISARDVKTRDANPFDVSFPQSIYHYTAFCAHSPP